MVVGWTEKFHLSVKREHCAGVKKGREEGVERKPFGEVLMAVERIASILSGER